ncbi:acetyltransferase [Rhodohalobacter sp. SW132]|uniref:acetyltransferase n=1 Tax=Rhodohalobacter sp. SW132 TaxID=2293433 RepID=UPI000E27D9FA|nr:acetyltransferase [Rhodohalobacter sp. SW132]REL38610.1 acetyltransferase [Rhodohalobacter sp. SW132]
MDDSPDKIKSERRLAETIREECLKAAREGFMDASMSGLCAEGAMEAAISAIQKLDLNKVIENHRSK